MFGLVSRNLRRFVDRGRHCRRGGGGGRLRGRRGGAPEQEEGTNHQGHAQRDDGFLRIGVLHHQVAGVAREVPVGDVLHRALPAGDRFDGSIKVIGHHLAAVGAGQYGDR